MVGATSAGTAGRALVGSTAERVVHGSPCAVAVVPKGFEGAGLHSIGVAYTASPEGEEALKAAAGLAARAGDAKLRVITVLHEEAGTLAAPRRGERAAEVLPEEIAAHHNLSARAALDDALRDAGDVEAETELVYGDPAEALTGVHHDARPARHGLARVRTAPRRDARRGVAQGHGRRALPGDRPAAGRRALAGRPRVRLAARPRPLG